MTPQELKALSKLIDLCRKKGVAKFSDPSCSFELGAPPQKRVRRSKDEISEDPKLSDEEWAIYSGGQVPGDF